MTYCCTRCGVQLIIGRFDRDGGVRPLCLKCHLDPNPPVHPGWALLVPLIPDWALLPPVKKPAKS